MLKSTKLKLLFNSVNNGLSNGNKNKQKDKNNVSKNNNKSGEQKLKHKLIYSQNKTNNEKIIKIINACNFIKAVKRLIFIKNLII